MAEKVTRVLHSQGLNRAQVRPAGAAWPSLCRTGAGGRVAPVQRGVHRVLQSPYDDPRRLDGGGL